MAEDVCNETFSSVSYEPCFLNEKKYGASAMLLCYNSAPFLAFEIFYFCGFHSLFNFKGTTHFRPN